MTNITKAAEFLLPKKGIDLEKWAVIACDQHTSSLEYWRQLEWLTIGSESTLELIFPEAYLSEVVNREKSIKKTAEQYIKNQIFDTHKGFVSIKRHISNGRVRDGIFATIDLEYYDYAKGSKKAIRASEGTVLERIPPRVKVREACPFDVSHVMLLYDDANGLVKAAENRAKKKPLYNFSLNMGGGLIVGELIEDTSEIEKAFDTLLEQSIKKYSEPFLFALGDGNHSLAAAKTVYEQAKKKGVGDIKRLRYAAVELVNIHSDAIEFEPIHRLAFIEPNDKRLEAFNSIPADPIAAVAFVDRFFEKIGVEVDYIHGLDNLTKLAKEKNATAIELKAINKDGFFPYIKENGALPKKTFSMGEAEDKRYYLEIRMVGTSI